MKPFDYERKGLENAGNQRFRGLDHSWLLANVPMDKRVLSEFLNAGIVFAGELFPADGVGISEGSNISPYLGNFVLDGLQKHIYRGLHGTEAPRDFADGNLRFDLSR